MIHTKECINGGFCTCSIELDRIEKSNKSNEVLDYTAEEIKKEQDEQLKEDLNAYWTPEYH